MPKVKASALKVNDVILAHGKEHKITSRAIVSGRMNVIGTNGLFESIPLNSTVAIK